MAAICVHVFLFIAYMQNETLLTRNVKILLRLVQKETEAL